VRKLNSGKICFACISAYLFICTLFFSCAQILNPGGGAKDTAVPQVVKYTPDSAAKNFKGKEINIAFDEYIQLKDLNSQLTVSPPLEIQPEVKLVKNKIINIEFKEPLKDNSTYTINFGSSIADITEGNVKENFQYVFSTGNFIDSLSLTGTVMYAQDLKPEKDVLVMLYSDFSDSVVFKRKPDYFGKTKTDGSFQINNIRNGKYKVIALKDEDENFLYTPVAEYFAFADSLIDLTKNKKVNLYLFKEEEQKLFLRKWGTSYGSVSLIFSKPIDKIETKGFNNTDTKDFLKEENLTRDTIIYWFPKFTDDSIQFYVDVNGNRFDTINICGCTLKKKKINAPEKLEVSSNLVPGKLFDYNPINLMLRFNHPVKLMEKGKILYSEDSVLIEKHRFFLGGKENSRKLMLGLILDTIPPDLVQSNLFKENKNYNILIPKGTFTDIFGLTNDSFKLEFKTQEQKYYGTLKVKLTTKTGEKKIVQLLDEKGSVIKSEIIEGNKDLFYDYLAPKNFKIRVIYDANNNGKWDTGNFMNKKQPEKVIYYTQPITVRSNWDLEIEWEIK